MKSQKGIYLSLFLTIALFLTSCGEDLKSTEGNFYIANFIIISIIILACLGFLIYGVVWLWEYIEINHEFFSKKRNFFYIGYLILWIIILFILFQGKHVHITGKSIVDMLMAPFQRASLKVILMRESLLIGLLFIHSLYLNLLPKHPTDLEWGHGIFGYQPYYRSSSRFEGSWFFAIFFGIIILFLMTYTAVNTYFLTCYIRLPLLELSIISIILLIGSIIISNSIIRNWWEIHVFLSWLMNDFKYCYKKTHSIPQILAYYKAFKIKDKYDSYVKFLNKYPNGQFSEEAKQELERHKKYANDQRNHIFSNGLANDIGCQVQAKEIEEGIILSVVSHLVEGYSADDNSPYVKWLYDSRESLIVQVNKRITRIINTICKKCDELPINEITIELKHGIRKGNQDKSTTIYFASISGKKLKRVSRIDDKKIPGLLFVTTNMIPQLFFQYESRKK